MAKASYIKKNPGRRAEPEKSSGQWCIYETRSVFYMRLLSCILARSATLICLLFFLFFNFFALVPHAAVSEQFFLFYDAYSILLTHKQFLVPLCIISCKLQKNYKRYKEKSVQFFFASSFQLKSLIPKLKFIFLLL